MATLRDGMPNWFDIVDFRQEVLHGHKTASAAPLFVDVGGAMGQQSIFFKKAYPGLEGRAIIQDQAQVVSHLYQALRVSRQWLTTSSSHSQFKVRASKNPILRCLNSP